jgi:CheY-like chemotaxis protein
MVKGRAAMTSNRLKKARYRYRVLCVDDTEFGAFIQGTVLRHEGYEVLICSDAMEAAAILKTHEIDLAVLSYKMPVMNGAELAAFCKAANPDTRVILISEWLGIPKRERAVADLFLEKSDEVHALLAGAEALLARCHIQPLLGSSNNHYATLGTEN